MSKIADAYFGLIKILIAACLVVMVVLVFGNVVLRYGFNSGITESEELSRLLFVWMTFLGAILALRDHGHLGMDMLVNRLPKAGKMVCFFGSHLIMLYVTWLLLEGSWEQTIINIDVAAPSTGLSMGLFYGIGIVFGVSVIAILLVNLARAATGRMGDRDLVTVTESEGEVEIAGLRKDSRSTLP
ncbi:TRAP transporter small permease [Skermanella sp. TT6]|uniref:TRAP transporter small permease protein n=1 Tax=Skermanella cutis TaxID=2775420 RepID=A0ABX7BC63_9PROT|nr:TRAP transporter small permease [Skermanella sp. TT6]QQP91325.1 TRAP transporter small permease [Skermanella sp. TT6]